MIEGLHSDVGADELRGILQTQATHHDERAETYEKQLKVLGPPDTSGVDLVTRRSVNTAQDLGDGVRRHHRRAVYLRFLAAHLAAGEVYRLDESDLDTLGLNERQGY